MCHLFIFLTLFVFSFCFKGMFFGVVLGHTCLSLGLMPGCVEETIYDVVIELKYTHQGSTLALYYLSPIPLRALKIL